MAEKAEIIYALYHALRERPQNLIKTFSVDGDNDSAELIVDTDEGCFVISSVDIKEVDPNADI